LSKVLWLAAAGSLIAYVASRGRGPRHEGVGTGADADLDPLDQTIDDSFPASDPPSYTAVTGSKAG
jgi:hypothetical protein